MVLYNSQSIKETYVNVHPHPLLLHQREDIDRSALSTGADLQGVLHMFASCVKEHHERTSVLRCVCLFLCCAFSFVSHQLKPISTLYHISFIPLPLVAYDSIKSSSVLQFDLACRLKRQLLRHATSNSLCSTPVENSRWNHQCMMPQSRVKTNPESLICKLYMHHLWLYDVYDH